MEGRKAQFVEGLEIARMFNGLPVSVNAHWVHGHKGTNFIRYFFYLAGELTPLNMIMAIAQAHEAEKEAAGK
jgi:membrane-associated HD superfamily phosphohydrolase